MSGSQEPHLSQHTEQIDGILKDLVLFLSEKADFGGAENGVQKCRDKRLSNACEELFKALGFDKKDWKYNVYRICGASSAQLNTNRSAVLIPVMVWGNTPTVEGMLLAPGSITHITKDVAVQVEAGATLDLFFMVKK